MAIPESLHPEVSRLRYSTGEEGEKLIREHLSPEQRLDTPIRLVAECPEITNDEVVFLPQGNIVAIDCPGYTFMNNNFPNEAAKLYTNVRNTMRRVIDGESPYSILMQIPEEAKSPDKKKVIINGSEYNPSDLTREVYKDVIPLTNSGDETIVVFPQDRTNPLQVIAYCLEYQAQFIRELFREEFAHVRSYLNEHKGSQFPTISAGVALGQLTASAPALETHRDDLKEKPRRLIVMGPELMVKAMEGKGHFVKHTSAFLDTGEFRITQLMPEIVLKELPLQYQIKKYIESMNKAGIKVLSPEQSGSRYWAIEAPKGFDPPELLSSLEKSIAILKFESIRLKKDAKFEDPYQKKLPSNQKSLSIKKAKSFAAGFTIPPRLPENSHNASGDVAFYDITGLHDFRTTIKNHGLSDELAAKLTTQAARFISQQVSKATNGQEWIFENIEVDNEDSTRLIIQRGVLEPDSRNDAKFTNNPEVFEAITYSIKYLSSNAFKKHLAKHLIRNYQADNLVAAVTAGLENSSFATSVGLISCEVEEDGLTWIKKEHPLQENYAWWRVVSGSLTAAGARVCGFMAHTRYKDRERLLRIRLAKAEITEEEKVSLENLTKARKKLDNISEQGKSTIVIQKKIWEALGKPGGDNAVVIETVPLKGMKPIDLVVIPF